MSAGDDPAESYGIVCSQQWTGDLNVSRLYCTIQCKTGRVPIVRIPTALTGLCVSTTWQNKRMHEWMTLLIRYVHLHISFWYINVYVERLLSATPCLGHYVTSVFRHLLPKHWNFLAQVISNSSKVWLWLCLNQFELLTNVMNKLYLPHMLHSPNWLHRWHFGNTYLGLSWCSLFQLITVKFGASHSNLRQLHKLKHWI